MTTPAAKMNGHVRTAEILDRQPPADVDAEHALVSIALTDPSRAGEICSQLEPSDFYNDQARAAFAAIDQCVTGDGVLPELSTVSPRLRRSPAFDKSDSVLLYLTERFERGELAVNADHYIGRVREAAARRKLLSVGLGMVQAAHDDGSIVDAVSSGLSGIQDAAAGLNGRGGRKPLAINMGTVEPQQINWTWPNRIPSGRITSLVAKPGDGKSWVALDWAARITTGTPWPDGSPCRRGSVLLMAAEDDPADVLAPRLDWLRADVSKIELLIGERRGTEEAAVTLHDVDLIDAQLRTMPDCRLVIVDPVGSYISGKSDGNKDNEVRSILRPLAALAAQRDVALLLVVHRRKAKGGSADESAMGSTAWVAAARAVWHISRDPANKSRRLLLPGKLNLAPEGGGLAFTIAGEPPSVHWERDAVAMSADDGLAAEGQRGRPAEQREAAVEWLRELLADGSMQAVDVRQACDAAGLSWRTVERAKAAAGVKIAKNGFGGIWHWSLNAK